MSDHMSLADRIRRARKQQKLSQQELADRAGVTLGVISNLERGRTRPTPANQRAILQALGLDVAEAVSSPEFDDDDTRQWPRDIAVVLDVMGMYLLSVPEEQRADRIHAITRFVFGLAREQGPY